MLKKNVLNDTVLTEDQMKRADVNGDGKISAADYALLKSYVLKRSK